MAAIAASRKSAVTATEASTVAATIQAAEKVANEGLPPAKAGSG